MPIKLTPWDAAEILRTPSQVAAYLEAAMEGNDPAHIVHALGVVARSKGMTKVAKKTGLNRESLYKALAATGSPSFATVFKVMQAVGLRVSVKKTESKPGKKHSAPRTIQRVAA